MSIFDAVRHISTRDAAERAGLVLQRRGSRHWACCPLHGERMPSMCFYDDGGWHCFGCNKGGDAVSLYRELYRVEPLAAARRLAEAFGISVDATSRTTTLPVNISEARKTLKAFENQRWARYCDVLHEANARLERYTSWDKAEFIQLLIIKAEAQTELEQMQIMDIKDWIEMYKREVVGDVQSG